MCEARVCNVLRTKLDAGSAPEDCSAMSKKKVLQFFFRFSHSRRLNLNPMHSYQQKDPKRSYRFDTPLATWVAMLDTPNEQTPNKVDKSMIDGAVRLDTLSNHVFQKNNAMPGEYVPYGMRKALDRVRFQMKQGEPWIPVGEERFQSCTWTCYRGEEHFRLVSERCTLHLVGRVHRETRSSSCPPSYIWITFPPYKHRGYQKQGMPTQTVWCGQGMMDGESVFWRVVDPDQPAFGFVRQCPPFLMCHESRERIRINFIFDTTRDSVPTVVFHTASPAPGWYQAAWSGQLFFLWDGANLLRLHRLPRVKAKMRGQECDLSISNAHLKVCVHRAYRQENRGHTHILDPYVGSHFAAYAALLCNHHLSHRSWLSPEALFKIYYNTPEADLAHRLPVRQAFRALSGISKVFTNPPFRPDLCKDFCSALHELCQTYPSVLVVALLPPLSMFNRWLQRAELQAPNEYVQPSKATLLKLKTPVVIYHNASASATRLEARPSPAPCNGGTAVAPKKPDSRRGNDSNGASCEGSGETNGKRARDAGGADGEAGVAKGSASRIGVATGGDAAVARLADGDADARADGAATRPRPNQPILDALQGGLLAAAFNQLCGARHSQLSKQKLRLVFALAAPFEVFPLGIVKKRTEFASDCKETRLLQEFFEEARSTLPNRVVCVAARAEEAADSFANALREFVTSDAPGDDQFCQEYWNAVQEQLRAKPPKRARLC